MSILDFAVWSPDEATFWSSWISAGICTAPREFSPEYPGMQITDQTSQGWTPVDNDGATVPGWHANVRVSGPLVAEMTYGLPQVGEDGQVLSIFDRTWATHIFALTEQPQDHVTGFPAGYRNATGVTYCDVRDIKTPTNGWV